MLAKCVFDGEESVLWTLLRGMVYPIKKGCMCCCVLKDVSDSGTFTPILEKEGPGGYGGWTQPGKVSPTKAKRGRKE